MCIYIVNDESKPFQMKSLGLPDDWVYIDRKVSSHAAERNISFGTMKLWSRHTEMHRLVLSPDLEERRGLFDLERRRHRNVLQATGVPHELGLAAQVRADGAIVGNLERLAKLEGHLEAGMCVRHRAEDGTTFLSD